MKNQQIVAVDFGSAYTKVGLRTDWNGSSMLVSEIPIAGGGEDYLVPSVVAEVRRNGEVRWLVGVEAARQVPGPEVTIHTHWKPQLLSRISNGNGTDPEELGVRYFQELRLALRRSPVGQQLPGFPDDIPARVCLPRLATPDFTAERILKVMDQAGWRLADPRPYTYEPVANMWGVLTRGRNATWKPRPQDFQPFSGREVDIFPMVENSPFFRMMRQMIGTYGAGVIDIGAFTTDFAYVEFDATFSADPTVPSVVQASMPFGVRQLDDSVREDMDVSVREVVQGLSSERWDRLKERLYDGKEQAIRNPEGGMLKLGDDSDDGPIWARVEEFGQQILTGYSRFRREASGPVHLHVLTGGGALIRPLQKTILDGLAAIGKGRVHDLADRSAREESLRSEHPDITEAEVDERLREDQNLIRGGTAMGATSVTLG